MIGTTLLLDHSINSLRHFVCACSITFVYLSVCPSVCHPAELSGSFAKSLPAVGTSRPFCAGVQLNTNQSIGKWLTHACHTGRQRFDSRSSTQAPSRLPSCRGLFESVATTQQPVTAVEDRSRILPEVALPLRVKMCNPIL